MNQQLAAAAAGAVFAVGLAIGGMTDPLKVIGFLDFAGAWDPSLAFVMGGAILVYAPLYRLSVRRKAPLCAEAFRLPTHRDIDGPLVFGSIAFGVGWGWAGFCPGPALVSVASFGPSALIFSASMLLGMAAFKLWARRARGP